MYKLDKLIEEGRKVMNDNPQRELTLYEIANIKEMSADDVYKFGELMYFAGAAIGARIGKGKAKN